MPTTTSSITKYYDAAIQEGPVGPAEAIAIISTARVDRDGEVVVPSGGNFTNYRRNPIVMYGHAKGLPEEGDAGLPVGKNLWIKPTPDGSALIARHKFDLEDAFAEKVCRKVKNEMLNSYSITFLPISMGPPTQEEIRKHPDWKHAKNIIREWELIEYSVVAMPANVDAVTLVKRGKLMSETSKGAVPYAAHPIANETWDAAAAVQRLRKWASSDGSGDKDTIDWKKYAEGFAVVDGPADDFDSYKLPHHDVKGGKLVTIPAGVSAAIGALNGARGGYQGPGKEQALAHLEKHREAAGKESGKSTHENQIEESDVESKAYDPDHDGDDDSPGSTDNPDEAEDDEEDEEPPLRQGHFAKCIAGNHKGMVGKIVSVHRGEMVPDVDDDVRGTKAMPAARMCCYKRMGEGHMPTQHHVGVHMKNLERIDDLKAPPKRKPKPEPEASRKRWNLAEQHAYMAAKLGGQSIDSLMQAALAEAFEVHVMGKV